MFLDLLQSLKKFQVSLQIYELWFLSYFGMNYIKFLREEVNFTLFFPQDSEFNRPSKINNPLYLAIQEICLRRENTLSHSFKEVIELYEFFTSG